MTCSGYQSAVAYEVAEAADTTTILATIPAGSWRVFEQAVGPFPHGSTVRLLVHASDGVAELDGGQRGPWVAAPAVVANDEAPPTPDLIEPQPEPYDCEACGGG